MQTVHVTNGRWRVGALVGGVLTLLVAGCGAAASPEASSALESSEAGPRREAATAQPIEPADLKKGVVVTMLAPEASSQPDATGSGHATTALDDAAPPPPPPPPPPPHKGTLPSKMVSAAKPTDSKPSGAPTPQQASAASLGHQLSGDDVDAAIGPKLRELRACAKLDSSVSIHLSIAPGGKVSESSATRSNPDDAQLRDCVASVLRGVAFQAASDARGSALSFELALKPLEIP